jgi:MFS superfamily sulfate permease-like transporter
LLILTDSPPKKETQCPSRRNREALAGWTWGDLGGDLTAGLTLAAIAVPEQMATSRLGGFPAELGFFVFIAGTLGFMLFGANRYLSSGADSTITPIFAGALALVAAQGSPAYAGLAAALALAVGAVLILAGMARLGWVASFLSVPVTTGFLAGIAVHIVMSQLPALLGIAALNGGLLSRCAFIASHLSQTDLHALLLGGIVFAASVATELLKLRLPGALVGLAVAMALTAFLGWHVPVVGTTTVLWPHPTLPAVAETAIGNLAALALLIAMIVMVQTAATTRAFTSFADPQDVNRDFIGVGAGNVLAGLFGLFPVNASPPRTAAVEQAGGRSQLACFAAAIAMTLLIAFGASLLRFVPLAALAGVLLAVALRIARPSSFLIVLRETPAEFALILATMAAIIVLPIQVGVAVGIGLSVLHGIWTITRTRVIEFHKIPGTSVWWPPGMGLQGETLADVRVVGFPAPLAFLNADEFRRGMIEIIERSPVAHRLRGKQRCRDRFHGGAGAGGNPRSLPQGRDHLRGRTAVIATGASRAGPLRHPREARTERSFPQRRRSGARAWRSGHTGIERAPPAGDEIDVVAIDGGAPAHARETRDPRHAGETSRQIDERGFLLQRHIKQR